MNESPTINELPKPKRPRGRPEGTKRGSRIERHNVTFTPDHWRYLQSQPGGPAETLRRLIGADMAKNNL